MKSYKSLSITIFLLLAFLSFSVPSFAQTGQAGTQDNNTQNNTQAAEPEHYRESALRRFEIIFTVSIPFTALHSYLAVRGVEMIRQHKIAPELGQNNWSVMGGLTLLFSGFIAFQDWLHTRGEDISEKVPVQPTPGGTIKTSSSMLDASIRYPAPSADYPTLVLLCMRF